MKTRIMSLGEIITLDVMKTIAAFSVLVASKKVNANLAEICTVLSFVLKSNMTWINDFKLGKVNEGEFTNHMIAAIKKASGVELSVAEFDNAWIKMCPAYSTFEAILKEAIDYNSQPGQTIIFISGTNPKDIRYLIEQLRGNKLECTVKADELSEIAGIKLYATYTAKKSKAELLEFVIKALSAQPTAQSILATSISSMLQTAQLAQPQQLDIKYIRSSNEIKEPVVKSSTDTTNNEIETQAAKLFVDTVIWNKQEQTLAEVLNNTQAVSQRLLVSQF